MVDFDIIEDLALMLFKDWRLDRLYNTNISSFEKVMDGFLIRSIPSFTNCKQNLLSYDTNLRVFTSNLTLEEQRILANFIVLNWMETQINDVRTSSLLLNDTDFKSQSISNVLKTKTDTRNQFREQTERDLMNYSLNNVNWNNLLTGNYYGL